MERLELGQLSIVGVEALRMLDSGEFELKTLDQIDQLNLGPHSTKLLHEAGCRPLSQPVRAKEIYRKVGLTEKQSNMTLEYLVNRVDVSSGSVDQLCTRYKDTDAIEFTRQYPTLRTQSKKSWLQEAIDDLTEDIDALGESYLARKIWGMKNLPWNYIPLIRHGERPIYAGMQLSANRVFR